ncbi:MAG: putative bifunctional diguanylate cyclase/phosphodiesterase [Actinomycetales bacterium]
MQSAVSRREVPVWRQTSSRRLFATYVAVSLVPVVILGVVLSALLARQAEAAGERAGLDAASLIARTAVAPQLFGHDLRQGLSNLEQAYVERTVRLAKQERQVLRLRLRDLDGRVVYADDGQGLGQRDEESVEAGRGNGLVKITTMDTDAQEARGRSGTGPDVVEAYVPLQSAQDARTIGVLEVYLPYDLVHATAVGGERVLVVTLAGGLFLLWLALIAISRSVTARLRRQADDFAYLAQYDGLTGLYNRTSFARVAGQAIAKATSAAPVAVALVDLDRFKEVNDTLGHGSGDELLAGLAQRLRGFVERPSSRGCREIVVARLGGDEFGLLLVGVVDEARARRCLSDLRTALAWPVDVAGLPLAVEASVGFALAPEDGDDLELLQSRADLAMYAAKRSKLGVLRYDPSQDSYDATSLTLVSELSRAILEDELVLHYQPKVAPRTGEVTGVEALVRWEHAERGLLMPGAFLGAAEQTELVDPLTDWVLHRALRDIQRLDRWERLTVAVNISARSLADADFADRVLAVVAATGCDPHRLVLEVTETALLVDPARAATTLTRLAETGIRISVDDFGAGQTSLGYLAQLPVAELKIDRSFVVAMTGDERSASIVRSIVDLAHTLGFTVTAEGVEDAVTLAAVADAGCDLVQGFLLSRPVTLRALIARLTEHRHLLDTPAVPAPRSAEEAGVPH